MTEEQDKRIIRVKKERNFTQIPNEIVHRDDLTMKAKGLYLIIASLPDNFDITKKYLQKKSKDGKKAFDSGWKELVDTGYIHKKPKRIGKGQFVGWEIYFHEEPFLAQSEQGENEEIDDQPTEDPKTGVSVPEDPENRNPQNGDLQNGNFRNGDFQNGGDINNTYYNNTYSNNTKGTNTEENKTVDDDKAHAREENPDQTETTTHNCFRFYEQHLNRPLDGLIMDKIKSYLDDFVELGAEEQEAHELIEYAIEKAVWEEAYSPAKYINRILSTWHSQGIYTKASAVESDQEFERNKKKREHHKKGSNKRSVRKENLPKWATTPPEEKPKDEPVSEEEQKRFQKRLEKLRDKKQRG